MVFSVSYWAFFVIPQPLYLISVFLSDKIFCLLAVCHFPQGHFSMIHTIKTALLYAHSQDFTKSSIFCLKTACYVHIAVQLKDLGSKFLHAVEPQGRMDFNNTVQRITFQPNVSLVDVTVNFFDDAINEADEGFLIVVRVDPANVSNEALVLVTIRDDDRT